MFVFCMVLDAGNVLFFFWRSLISMCDGQVPFMLCMFVYWTFGYKTGCVLTHHEGSRTASKAKLV